MKSTLRIGAYLVLSLLALTLVYFTAAFGLGAIPVNTNVAIQSDAEVYIGTNGVHLDIIVPKELISKQLIEGLQNQPETQFYAFGWGDENFYLNTPTWGDLTFKNAFSALFLKSSTLMHVTRYNRKLNDWRSIKLSKESLTKLNQNIAASFQLDAVNRKIRLPNSGYHHSDDFYRAVGSYSCFKTCNSWANSVLKASDLPACVWTPFDFHVLKLY